MKSVLKYDRVILIKEMNDKIKKVGEVFEIANILENSFVLREAKSKVAVGVINFKDFDNFFVHEENFRGWTNWVYFTGFDGQNDCMYRTNRKKTQVRFLTDKVMGESFLNKEDDFNLAFGLNLAYLRARNKVIAKKKTEYENKLKNLDNKLKNLDVELMDNERIIKDMINRLES